MREVDAALITTTVKELVIKANKILPDDLVDCISCSDRAEHNETAKAILYDLKANIAAAKELDIPVCQDTGMAVIFAEIGQEVHITGGDFEAAVNKGVSLGYTDGLLRKSVVRDPFYDRVNTNDNTPAIIHTRIVAGDKIKITAAPKGFGSENMSRLDIGPQGFGGRTTALAVNIETYPTHIAGLPVAVNVGCHVTRHASKEI